MTIEVPVRPPQVQAPEQTRVLPEARVAALAHSLRGTLNVHLEQSSSLIQPQNMRLSTRGKEVARSIFEGVQDTDLATLRGAIGEARSDITRLLKGRRAELKAEAVSEVAARWEGEGRERKGNAAEFRGEVKVRLGERVATDGYFLRGKTARKLLTSVAQRGRAVELKGQREEIKKGILPEEIASERRRLVEEGKRDPGEAFAREIIATRLLYRKETGQGSPEVMSQQDEQAVKIITELEASKARLRLGITRAVHALGMPLRAIKKFFNTPADPVRKRILQVGVSLGVAAIAAKTVGFGGKQTPEMVQSPIETPPTAQAPEITKEEVEEVQETMVQKVLREQTTEFPGIEGARKLIPLTTHELKEKAKAGELFFENNHPVVIVEAEYLYLLASQPLEMREKLLDAYVQAIVAGLEHEYKPNDVKELIVELEAGHMSNKPPGKTTQDTGAAPCGKFEGGNMTEREANIDLSKRIARVIRERHPEWIPVLNADEQGFDVDQVATYKGNEYGVRCLDTLMHLRPGWEALAATGVPTVRLAVHHNGIEGNRASGGMTIPQAEGDDREKSVSIATTIAQTLPAWVGQVMGSYKANMTDLDVIETQKGDCYPISDTAKDNPDDVKNGLVEKVRGKANRYVARLRYEAIHGRPFLDVVGPTKNS